MKNGWLVSFLVFAALVYWIPSKNTDSRGERPTFALEARKAAEISPLDALPSPPPIEAVVIPSHPLLYVVGNKVALREHPDNKAKILDRLNNGLLVYEEQRDLDWVKVRHSITQQIGWVTKPRLTSEPPKEEPNSPKPEPSKRETITKAAIVALLIERSVAEYRETRPCACPYNTDRSGRACGKRSAWSRPGGAKPLCYAEDVTEEMVAGFK